MFDSLIESRPVHERNLPQTVVSIVTHTIIFAAAIQLTRAAAQPRVHHPTDFEMPLIAHHDIPQPPSSRVPPPAASSISAAPSFQSVPAPTNIPTSIPPIDLHQTFDPRRFTGIGTEGGPPDRFPTDTLTGSMDQSYSRAEVDTPAEYIGGPTPRFPSALRTAGIEGTVLLQFVVGVDGRVEAGSIHVMESTNRAFEEPAIAAVSGSTFKPGRIRGRSVRQLVEQSVRFQLTPGG